MDSTIGKGRRVALLTYGTRGDVEPFIALAEGLQRAGFTPRLAAPAVFEPLVQAHRVEFHPLPGNPARLAKDLVALAGTNWPRMVSTVSRFVAPLGAQVFRHAIECAADADLIVHSFLMTQTGHELARRHGIPSISAQMFPVFAPTSAFPAVISPDIPGCGLYRRLTHVFVTQVFWQGSRILYNGVRREEPALPTLSGWPFSGPRMSRPWIMFAFSRHVVPPPSDWSGVAEVTGYWPLGAHVGWKAPLGLERFLAAGPPPVYVGLGSGGEAAGAAWIDAAEAALAECGLRGLCDLGSSELTTDHLPETIYAVRDIPHAWLFPRVAAVVHHGGAGTTGAGLAAGRPTIVVPTTSDQPFWGRRVHALGAGPRPIPIRRLTARGLAQAISVAVGDPAMRTRADELGKRIGTEDGISVAVARIAELLGQQPST
jgi:sterol 3beta-glucosyltransferase